VRRFGLILLVPACALLAGSGACSDSGGGDGDQALFCERLDRLTRNDPFLAFGDTASADDIEVAFRALVERSEELVAVAPRDGRAAARDYAEAVDALDSILAGAAYDPLVVDAGEYVARQADYATAAQRLERYLDATC
jgi:hypothetical protein